MIMGRNSVSAGHLCVICGLLNEMMIIDLDCKRLFIRDTFAGVFDRGVRERRVPIGGVYLLAATQRRNQFCAYTPTRAARVFYFIHFFFNPSLKNRFSIYHIIIYGRRVCHVYNVCPCGFSRVL